MMEILSIDESIVKKIVRVCHCHGNWCLPEISGCMSFKRKRIDTALRLILESLLRHGFLIEVRRGGV